MIVRIWIYSFLSCDCKDIILFLICFVGVDLTTLMAFLSSCFPCSAFSFFYFLFPCFVGMLGETERYPYFASILLMKTFSFSLCFTFLCDFGTKDLYGILSYSDILCENYVNFYRWFHSCIWWFVANWNHNRPFLLSTT